MTFVERIFVVAGMAGHCELSVREDVAELGGADSATADAVSGRLVVRGAAVDDRAGREAVAAGYRAVS